MNNSFELANGTSKMVNQMLKNDAASINSSTIKKMGKRVSENRPRKSINFILNETVCSKNCKTEASSFEQKQQYLICDHRNKLINTVDASDYINKYLKENVADENKEELQAKIIENIIFHEYPDLIASTEDPIGVVTRCEHEIKLKADAKPFKEKVRRVPVHLKEEFEKDLDRMIERGVISPSNADFASPVVLVRKKTGELRICIDYRKLNDISIKDNYPLPFINELVHDKLSGTKFFTSLDLADGYHQIPIKAEDKHKTAFITEKGLFEFNVMAFGLTSAPATFQRMMNDLLE
jgi:hypothetical protein